MHTRPQFYIHISTPLCRFWKIDLQKSQIKSSASELVQLVKCQQNLVHCQTIFAIFMLLCYHWIPIYLLVQIQLTLMEWSIQCVSKNIK